MPIKARYVGDPLRAELAEHGWFTPDTYDNYIFEDFPSKPGVYLLSVANISPVRKGTVRRDTVAYVGKSVNLRARHRNHEVVNAIYKQMDSRAETMVRWWKELGLHEIDEAEIKLIKKYNPPFNVMHRLKVIYS